MKRKRMGVGGRGHSTYSLVFLEGELAQLSHYRDHASHRTCRSHSTLVRLKSKVLYDLVHQKCSTAIRPATLLIGWCSDGNRRSRNNIGSNDMKRQTNMFNCHCYQASGVVADWLVK